MFFPLLPEYSRVIMHCNALPFYLIEVSQKVGLVQELKIPSFISFVSTSSQIPCLTSHEDKRVRVIERLVFDWVSIEFGSILFD